jgi:anti-sigma regulatory factor (Ser/Thr protein kinase)
MTELHFNPIKGKALEILRAILQTPEVSSCKLKDGMLLRLACEEIVMNITSYAYPAGITCPTTEKPEMAHSEACPTTDYLYVEIDKKDGRIVICFKDGGIPFNPLEHKKPDTSLSWKQRPIGGLGIYLVLKKMDAVRYAYTENQNVLTIELNIEH